MAAGSYGSITLSGTHSANVTFEPDPAQDPNGAGKVTFTGINVGVGASHIVIHNFYVTGEVSLNGTFNGASTTFITVDHNDISGSEGVTNASQNCSSVNAPVYSGCVSWAPTTDLTISGNRIHDTSLTDEGDAIHLNNWQRVHVTANEFYHIEECAADTCHTDCLQSVWGGSDMTFDHNYEHDNECQGFFLKDGDVTNVTFTENLFLRDNVNVCSGSVCGNGAAVAQIFDSHNVVVENNTLWDTKGLLFRADGSGYDATVENNVASALTNNVCCGTVPYTTFTTSNNIIGGNPTFMNTAADDYRLASNPSGIGVNWAPSQYTYGPTN